MNCYKVGYTAVWVSGGTRSTSEGVLSILAENGTVAGQIATANVPVRAGVAPDEIHIGHIHEVAKNVIGAMIADEPVIETVAGGEPA